MTRVLVSLIHLYQRTLSPDHGWFRERYPLGFCRFHPTCSEYAAQAIKHHGATRGILLAGWRVLRCNPFNRGGVDPVSGAPE